MRALLFQFVSQSVSLNFSGLYSLANSATLKPCPTTPKCIEGVEERDSACAVVVFLLDISTLAEERERRMKSIRRCHLGISERRLIMNRLYAAFDATI